MKNNFWQKLNKPILALAPMAGITDSAFRQICAEFGTDVLYSEMASATALNYSPEKTLEMLKFDRAERPYVVQLFGNNPKHFAIAVKIIEKEIKPDGIDINFGCPAPKVIKQGAGAELAKDLKLSREVIKSVIGNTDLPVSIKIRAGMGDIDALRFLDNVCDLNIKALMVHGRTLRQGFVGEIDFEIIKKSRENFSGIILANGGIMNLKDSQEILAKTEADGIGIARGALGNPWIFQEIKEQKNIKKQRREIFAIALKQAELSAKLKGKQGILEMRKHLCWYMQNMPGAKKMREQLVKVESMEDIEEIFKATFFF